MKFKYVKEFGRYECDVNAEGQLSSKYHSQD